MIIAMKMWHWLLLEGIIVLDQVSKWAAQNYIKEPIELISTISLQLHQNPGFAFSLPAPRVLLTAFSFIAAIIIFWWGVKQPKMEKLGAVLVAAGAIGNGIDRLLFGSVTDMISVSWFSIFNVADITITIGCICLLLGTKKAPNAGGV